MTKPAPTPSRGSVALKQCGDSPTQIAKRTGASYPVVHNWQRGHRKPSDEWRVVLEKNYGIMRTWWEEPPPVPTAGGFLERVLPSGSPPGHPLDVASPKDRDTADHAASRVPAAPIAPLDARGEALALVAQIRKFRDLVDVDPTASLSERAKVMHGITRDMDHLFRLTGEAANIPEARLLASPAWARIKQAIEGALVPYHAALAAVVAALEGVSK